MLAATRKVDALPSSSISPHNIVYIFTQAEGGLPLQYNLWLPLQYNLWLPLQYNLWLPLQFNLWLPLQYNLGLPSNKSAPAEGKLIIYSGLDS